MGETGEFDNAQHVCSEGFLKAFFFKIHKVTFSAFTILRPSKHYCCRHPTGTAQHAFGLRFDDRIKSKHPCYRVVSATETLVSICSVRSLHPNA